MIDFSIEDMEYDRDVLQALLYYSTSEDDFMLPTIEEFILSEAVNGTLEYLGRDAGKVRYQDFKGGRDSFESAVWDYFEEEPVLSDKVIDPDVMASISRMAGYHIVYSDGPDRAYAKVGLYSTFKSVLLSGMSMSSTFSLMQKDVYHVQKGSYSFFI
ncbi:MAG: hypothetical protein U9O53_04485 [archaeon]|nr:hypothetical protein [archaeon]